MTEHPTPLGSFQLDLRYDRTHTHTHTRPPRGVNVNGAPHLGMMSRKAERLIVPEWHLQIQLSKDAPVPHYRS
jgi:hypothetical protein